MPHFATFRRALRAATPALALGAAGFTAALAACSDSPTGPVTAVQPAAARATAQGPSHSTSTTTSATSTATSSTTLTPVQGLLRTAPLAQTVVVTKYLPNGGGGIDVPGHRPPAPGAHRRDPRRPGHDVHDHGLRRERGRVRLPAARGDVPEAAHRRAAARAHQLDQAQPAGRLLPEFVGQLLRQTRARSTSRRARRWSTSSCPAA